MVVRIVSLTGLLVASVLAVGCAGSVHEGMARSRAANEMGCSQADLRMTYLGSGGWVAEGCGQTMHLACNGYSGGDGFCVVENNAADERAELQGRP